MAWRRWERARARKASRSWCCAAHSTISAACRRRWRPVTSPPSRPSTSTSARPPPSCPRPRPRRYWRSSTSWSRTRTCRRSSTPWPEEASACRPAPMRRSPTGGLRSLTKLHPVPSARGHRTVPPPRSSTHEALRWHSAPGNDHEATGSVFTGRGLGPVGMRGGPLWLSSRLLLRPTRCGSGARAGGARAGAHRSLTGRIAREEPVARPAVGRARLPRAAAAEPYTRAMARHHFRIVNVFTHDRGALTGNPLCVFEDGARLDTPAMQALARQFNLSETTFILPSERAEARVRIFTPTHEMPFAGHPTLGTAHVCRALGLGGNGLTLEMTAGVIPVTAEIDEQTGRPSMLALSVDAEKRVRVS